MPTVIKHEEISQDDARGYKQVAALLAINIDVLLETMQDCATVEQVKAQVLQLKNDKDIFVTDAVEREGQYAATMWLTDLFNMGASNASTD